jgi:hypothetical protein
MSEKPTPLEVEVGIERLEDDARITDSVTQPWDPAAAQAMFKDLAERAKRRLEKLQAAMEEEEEDTDAWVD